MWEIKGANIKNLDRYFGGLGQAPNRTRTFCSTWDFCWRWNPPLLTIYQKSLASAEWHFPMAIFPFVGRGRLSEGCQHVSPWGWTAYFGNKCWVNIHRNLNLITWLLMILDKQVFFFFFSNPFREIRQLLNDFAWRPGPNFRAKFSGTRVTKQHALLLVWGLFSGGGKRKGGFGGHECAGWGRLATVEGLAVRGTAHGHGKVF